MNDAGDDTRPARLPWLQFGLRVALWLAVIAALGAGWWRDSAQRDRRIKRLPGFYEDVSVPLDGQQLQLLAQGKLVPQLPGPPPSSSRWWHDSALPGRSLASSPPRSLPPWSA